MTFETRPALNGKNRTQKGLALVFVLLMLTVVTVMAAIAARLTVFAERTARNDRDRQIAMQAAEAALSDAEIDIMGPTSATNKRCTMYAKDTSLFSEATCGNDSTAKTRGLCSKRAATTAPYYETVDFDETDDVDRRYATFGEFTGRAASFKYGSPGESAQQPKYIIEAVDYVPTVKVGATAPGAAPMMSAFLVTALGYGTNADTRVMLQAMVFKPLPSKSDGDC